MPFLPHLNRFSSTLPTLWHRFKLRNPFLFLGFITQKNPCILVSESGTNLVLETRKSKTMKTHTLKLILLNIAFVTAIGALFVLRTYMGN